MFHGNVFSRVEFWKEVKRSKVFAGKKRTLPAIFEDGEGSLESGGGGGATSCGSAVVFDSLVCRDDRDLDRTWLESNLSRNIVVVFSSSTTGYGSDENIHTQRDREFLRHTAFSSQKINFDVQTLKRYQTPSFSSEKNQTVMMLKH
jgi:hypothetical protein